MALLKVFKETALPGTLVADAVYYVTDPNTAYVQIYVTSTTAVARRIPTTADITTLINNAMAGAGQITVVADIAARNAQASPAVGKQTLVLNATGDATVASGGATYVISSIGPTVWTKISETESLDVALTWAAITGKPTSSPAAIDAAVANSHTHANKTQLDLIGDTGGNLTYNAVIVKTEWTTTAW
jgi:hypothetical protein